MDKMNNETYTYHYNDDIITLIIGDETDIYEGEGILQKVDLIINNIYVYGTTFGREHVLSLFELQEDYVIFDVTILMFDNNTLCLNIGGGEYLTISGSKYLEFMCWVTESLTPIVTKRKTKIDKIKENIKKNKYVL